VTLSRREVSELLARDNLKPRRDLGQNFVVDPNTVRRVARLAEVGAGDRVAEIGAGLGSLTLALAETGAAVVAVEVDPSLVAVLRSVVAGVANVEVVEGDALRLEWDRLLAPDQRWVVVANLPYNVATPVVMRLLEEAAPVWRMLVMVQAEVAARLAAVPGTKAYGAVSVKVSYWAEARLVGTVPSSVFLPRPRVDSALVSIVRRPTPAVEPRVVSYERLIEVVQAGFAHRRKMLRRSLWGVVRPEAFVVAGVSPRQRPQELDVAAWGRLARWGTRTHP